MFIVSYSCRSIDLTSLYVLFSQYKSRDNTLRNSFFQISSYLREHLRIHCEKTAGQVPLGPLLGKQNIQAKEVYCAMLQTYNEIDVTRFSYIRWAAKLCIYCQLQGGGGGGGGGAGNGLWSCRFSAFHYRPSQEICQQNSRTVASMRETGCEQQQQVRFRSDSTVRSEFRIRINEVPYELFTHHASWCPKGPLKKVIETFSWCFDAGKPKTDQKLIALPNLHSPPYLFWRKICTVSLDQIM